MRQLIGHTLAMAVPAALFILTNAEFADRWDDGQGMGPAITVVFGAMAAFVSLVAVAIAIIVHGATLTDTGRERRKQGALACLGSAGMALVWLVVMMSSVDTRGLSLSHSEEEPAFLAATLTGLGLMWAYYFLMTARRKPVPSR